MIRGLVCTQCGAPLNEYQCDYCDTKYAVEKGIEVANKSMQDRLSGMNEFRSTMSTCLGGGVESHVPFEEWWIR